MAQIEGGGSVVDSKYLFGNAAAVADAGYLGAPHQAQLDRSSFI